MLAVAAVVVETAMVVTTDVDSAAEAVAQAAGVEDTAERAAREELARRRSCSPHSRCSCSVVPRIRRCTT